MKNWLKGILAAVACFSAATFVSCGDDGNDGDGTRAALSATPLELSFVSAGETKTVSVKAENVAWEATTTALWLTLSGTTGTQDGTLTVTADPNYSTEQLTGSITISGEGVQPVTVSVTQLADDTPRMLEVSTKALTFTCSNYYSRVVDVDAENVVWDVTSGADWLHAEKRVDPEFEDEYLVVSVDPNSGAARQTTLTLSGQGIEPVVIAVSQRALFESELIGQYVPALKYWDALGQDAGDLFINAQWTAGFGPKIPVSIPGLFPDGVDWMMLDGFLLPVIGALYSQGLDSFTFRDDGTFAATYHAMSGDFMNPSFDPAISEYPTAETLEELPGGVLSYYTEDGKFYVSLDKNFLNEIAADDDMGDIGTVIDAFLAMYPGLTLVSTPEYFALPFNYTLVGGKLTLSVDRDMMLPYKDLLKDVIPLLLSLDIIDAEMLQEIGIDPSNPKPLLDFIEELFSTSTQLEIGIRLEKK